MRKLAVKDVFTMSRIITKMDIRDELRAIANSGEESSLNLGIDMVLTILTKVSDRGTEKQIYEFLADVTESTEEAIMNSDPFELIDSLSNDDGAKQWKDFFSKVSKLLSRQSSLPSEPTETA